MCNTSMHHRPFNGVVDPFSFSTFHLLRTCNRLMLPSSDIQTYYNIVRENGNSTVSPQNISGLSNLIGSKSSEIYNPNDASSKSPILDVMETLPLTEEDLQITDSSSPQNLHESPESNPAHSFLALRTEVTETDRTSSEHVNSLILEPAKNVETPTHQTTFIGLPPTRNMLPLVVNNPNHSNSPLPAFEYIAPATQHHVSPNDFPLMELNRVGVSMGGSNMFPGFLHRRPRGEKRPIPDEQKDDKYYERRKRNNEAAKKSRDARKIREDRIAFRAALLEQENSILRAQVMALRDELQTMRQLMSTGAPMGRVSTT